MEIPRNFVRGIFKLLALKVNRTVNERCSLKFMFVVIFFLSKIFDEVYMLAVADINSAGGFATELMIMSVRKISMKLHLMKVVLFTREIHSLAGYGAEPVIMTVVRKVT